MNTCAADHAACAEVLRRSGSSFAMPIRLLPLEKRRGTTALYALCRRVDDIVDDASDAVSAEVSLNAFESSLHAALAGEPAGDPVVRALVDTVRRFGVPKHYLDDIVDGVRMDLTHHVYNTFADLEGYCRRVASAVGLAAIHIWGFRTTEALSASHACGLAFQLTNILRDIPEDLARGRIYIPQEVFVDSGCSVDDLRAGRIGKGFAGVAEITINRAEMFFQQAESLDTMLSTDGRTVWRAMFGVYRAMLGSVRRCGVRIFTQRVRPSRPLMTGAAVATLLMGPRRTRPWLLGPTIRPATQIATPEVSPQRRPRVIVVGGGLAGLAAAASLAECGRGLLDITVLEGRRRAGGRAASFEDPVAGGLVDACQHVAMGCCTNFIDLCHRVGCADALRKDRTMWFIAANGLRSACTPSGWLPAPLHLAPLLLSMSHFTLREKAMLALGMLRLARYRRSDADTNQTAVQWLESIGQPAQVIRLFWQPVLESALGESIDLVSVAAARKVVVDGFMAHREATTLLVPTQPLGVLFGERLVKWLEKQAVTVQTDRTVTAIARGPDALVYGVRCGELDIPCDAVIVALPWKQTARLLPDLVPAADEQLAGSPITAVHVWFDRDVIDLPHAVLVGRVSQWVFCPSVRDGTPDTGTPCAAEGYCQVVISASRGLLGGNRELLLETVIGELRELFPLARESQVVDTRIVTDPTAVLSVRPGVEQFRPPTRTAVGNLFLAGDWTATGWPSTMEGAVRSGRSAAAAVAEHVQIPSLPLTPDLPKNLLVRLITGRE